MRDRLAHLIYSLSPCECIQLLQDGFRIARWQAQFWCNLPGALQAPNPSPITTISLQLHKRSWPRLMMTTPVLTVFDRVALRRLLIPVSDSLALSRPFTGRMLAGDPSRQANSWSASTSVRCSYLARSYVGEVSKACCCNNPRFVAQFPRALGDACVQVFAVSSSSI